MIFNMHKRQFIQLSVKTAAVMALLPSLTHVRRANANNQTRFEKHRLFRGFKNNDDVIFQGFAYHAFHNGRAPRVMLPDGTYTYFIDSFIGNVVAPNARIKRSTPRVEPGYWLVAVKLDEMYNTGKRIDRFQGKRVDVFQYAVDEYADSDLAGGGSLSAEMRCFIQGVKAFMDKYSTTSRHTNRPSICDKDIERYFMSAIYFSAYRHSRLSDEGVMQKVENYMSSAASERHALAMDVFSALEKMGQGDNKSTDPNNPFNRQYIAAWSSYVMSTISAVYRGDVETSQLIERQIEMPLRRFVPRIRPDRVRGEAVLKI